MTVVRGCVPSSSLRSAVISVLLAAGCGGPSSSPQHDVLEAIVARDAVWFDSTSVPAPLVASLAETRVLLLGETHYVQEHQEFVVRMLGPLHAAGFRFLLQEQMQAVAWAGEEYAMLRSEELPPEVAAFDQTLLQGLRAFNEPLAESDRMHFVGFDMNHWTGIFPTYVDMFQLRFGRVPELDLLLSTTPDSGAYAAALAALPAELETDETALVATLGPARYAQLRDLVEVEVRSRPLRHVPHDAEREAFSEDRVAKALREAGDVRVAVNTGAYHAQKMRLGGPANDPTGTWLVAHPELYGGDATALRNIFFVGAKGEMRSQPNDPRTTSFDVTRDAGRDDLARIVAEQAAGRCAWLPLTDPRLRDPVEFDGGDMTSVVPLGAAFDAFVQYPQVTVLSSLSILFP